MVQKRDKAGRGALSAWQWRCRASIYSSAWTKYINTCYRVPATCVCMSLHSSLCLCLDVQKYNVARQYSMFMTSQINIVWYNSKCGKLQGKEIKCMTLYCLSVCPCLSETVCAHTFCMQLHCFDMLSHSISVSVCPCLSETACARTFCMWLHCFDMLSHSMSVSVFPCLSETVCARTFCMRLHCFNMLSHSISVCVPMTE